MDPESPHDHIKYPETDHKTTTDLFKETWKDVMKRDLTEVGGTAEGALDRERWRRVTRTECAATE